MLGNQKCDLLRYIMLVQLKKCMNERGTSMVIFLIQIHPTKTADSIGPFQVIRFLRDGSSKTTSLIYTKIL